MKKKNLSYIAYTFFKLHFFSYSQQLKIINSTYLFSHYFISLTIYYDVTLFRRIFIQLLTIIRSLNLCLDYEMMTVGFSRNRNIPLFSLKYYVLNEYLAPARSIKLDYVLKNIIFR